MSTQVTDEPGRNGTGPAPSLAARLLVRLNRFFPPLPRPQYFQTEAYQSWLEKGGDDLYTNFYSRFVALSGRRVLDLACGYGGKLTTYGRRGPRLICGLDINLPVLREAQRKASGLHAAAAVAGDVFALPFVDASFDVVISDDGFDHFTAGERVLEEMARVLKPGGTAFISFVPYYSTNCSHMEEYLRLPWHHVLFPRSALKQALVLIAQEEAPAGADPAALRRRAEGVFDVFASHLSGLTVSRFARILAGRRGWRLVRLRKQCADWARPLTYLPVVREPITTAVHCVLRRDDHSRITRIPLLRQAAPDLAQDTEAASRRLRRAGGRILGGGKGLAKALLPARWVARLKRSDLFLKQHYAERLAAFPESEEPELAVIRHLVQPGDLAVDVGANIGVYTKFLSGYVGPAGRVISIEPVPTTCGFLAHNVRVLGLENVKVVSCAISDRGGTVTMELPRLASGASDIYLPRIVQGAADPGATVTVPACTLDGLLGDSKPSFVKVDVEGHELPCLRGARRLLEDARPAWLIEVTTDPDREGTEASALLALLMEAGYQPFWFDGSRLRPRLPGDRSVNWFFLRREHRDRLG